MSDIASTEVLASVPPTHCHRLHQSYLASTSQSPLLFPPALGEQPVIWRADLARKALKPPRLRAFGGDVVIIDGSKIVSFDS